LQAQDSVRRHVGADFGLERGLHINVREDSKPSSLERRDHSRHLVKRRIDGS
jgi:hypothetical protein